MQEKRIIALFALAAGAIVAGTVVAAVVVLPEASVHNGPCSIEDTRGSAIAPASQTTDTGAENGRSKAVRTLTYSVPASDEADAFACVSTGSVKLGISGNERVTIEVTVVGWGGNPDAARFELGHVEPVVRAGHRYFAALEHRSWHAFGGNAAMSVKVLVPATMRLDADLSTGTGSITIDGPRLAGLDASAGTGGLQLRPSFAEGALDVSTGTGGIDARFPALGNASLDFSAGTSGMHIAVPGDASHGYRVDASAGTGGVAVELPDMQAEAQRGAYEGATRGYASKPVHVAMDMSTGTGGITITTV